MKTKVEEELRQDTSLEGFRRRYEIRGGSRVGTGRVTVRMTSTYHRVSEYQVTPVYIMYQSDHRKSRSYRTFTRPGRVPVVVH